MNSNSKPTGIDAILQRAKKDVKGRYYIYEMYKTQIQLICPFGPEYDRAMAELARILKV